MAMDIEKLLAMPRPAVVTEVERGGSFVLLEPKPGPTRASELAWIGAQVKESSPKEVKTVLIELYDLIPESELRDRGLLDDPNFSLIRALPGAEGIPVSVMPTSMTIPDDLPSLRRALSGLIAYCKEHGVPCHIVLYTLSWLIQSHGWKGVYQLLTSNIPALKGSPVQLFGFLYPETHSDESEVASLEKLA